MAKPTKTPIKLVEKGAPGSPETVNTPLQNLESNIDKILAYLNNDGHGSTINADKVDGYEGSELAVLSENETVSGSWTFSTKQTFSGELSSTGNIVLDNNTRLLGKNTSGGEETLLYRDTSNRTRLGNTSRVTWLSGTNLQYHDGTTAHDILHSGNWNDARHGYRGGGNLHAAATQSTAGFMSASDKAKLDGIAAGANNYTLPTASSTVLGGIRVGSRLTISNGVLSADVQSEENFTSSLLSKLNGIEANANRYVLPTASSTTLGGVKVGTDLSISNGVLSVNSSNYAKLNESNTFQQNQFAPKFVSQSDRELKENIKPIDFDTLDFSGINAYSWTWKKSGELSLGTMADEVAEKFMPLVGVNEDGKPIGVDYGKLAFLMAMYLLRNQKA